MGGIFLEEDLLEVEPSQNILVKVTQRVLPLDGEPFAAMDMLKMRMRILKDYRGSVIANLAVFFAKIPITVPAFIREDFSNIINASPRDTLLSAYLKKYSLSIY